MRLVLSDIWAAPPGATQPAVQGVSLEVGAGEWVALGGANGCGKTTLLLVAAGLLAPRRGIRRLAHEDGRSLPMGTAPRVATILQDPSVQLFAETVAEEIGLTALHLGTPAGEIEAQVRRWSAALGLEDELARAPQTLSAGRQQLVLIAAALASRPDLLVADEAGAHLDSASRARVLELLREEAIRGVGILWATQDPDEQRAAGRFVLLDAPAGARSVPADWSPARGVPMEAGEGGGEADPADELFMILRVAPAASIGGPCVRTARAFELQLPKRGIVCLEGPNGVGKSVLLSVACGLIEVSQIRADPGNLGDKPPLLVTQYPERQIFEETIRQEVAFAAVSRGVPRRETEQRAEAVFGRLEMATRLTPDRRTWELSSGEKRLVLLVGALIAPAALLALDEPTAGLDPRRREILAQLIRERALRDLVLVASQDTRWLRDLAGRVVPLPPPPTSLKSQQKNGLTATCEEH